MGINKCSPGNYQRKRGGKEGNGWEWLRLKIRWAARGARKQVLEHADETR